MTNTYRYCMAPLQHPIVELGDTVCLVSENPEITYFVVSKSSKQDYFWIRNCKTGVKIEIHYTLLNLISKGLQLNYVRRDLPDEQARKSWPEIKKGGRVIVVRVECIEQSE